MEEIRERLEHLLVNAVSVVDAAVTLRQRVKLNAMYVTHLRALADRATRVTSSLKVSEQAYLLQAQKLSQAAIATLSLVGDKQREIDEYQKLLDVVQKELTRFGQGPTEGLPFQGLSQSHTNIPDRIAKLKEYQHQRNYPPTTTEQHRNRPTSSERTRNTRLRNVSPGGSKSIKILKPFDEKYPECFSRDSLVELNTVVQLPPVPEDVFQNLSNAPPQRCASLCSVKSLRRVKQRFFKNSAITEEDECLEEAEFKTHDLNVPESPCGSEQDLGARGSQPRKPSCLSNIKEEVNEERETLIKL